MSDKPRLCQCLDCEFLFKAAWTMMTQCPRCGRGFTLLMSEHEVELLSELASVLESAIRNLTSIDEEHDGQWYDSMARSCICDWGDRLVELGLWEKKPGIHVGRRQFYRPKVNAEIFQ